MTTNFCWLYSQKLVPDGLTMGFATEDIVYIYVFIL